MCGDARCIWREGKNPCPWEIGQHSTSLADARDQLIASQALGVTGRIPLEEAERMYAAWRKRAGLAGVRVDAETQPKEPGND